MLIQSFIPETYFSQDGMSAHGLGDLEIGTFPLVELPTGDQSQGLGNGRTWFKAPIWLQKSSGAWTSYGGGGYAYNPAPGQRNYFFGGLLVQRTLTSRLTLGGEVFLQGAQVQNDQTASAGAGGVPR